MLQELKGGYMNTTLKIFEEEKSANALVIRTYGGLGEKVVHLYHVCTAEGKPRNIKSLQSPSVALRNRIIEFFYLYRPHPKDGRR